MDIVIKGNKDGIEVADKLQRDFRIPVIFLTAYADEETLQRAELTRAYGYLVKPVQERELNAMVRIVLNRHARDEELLQTIASVEQMGQSLGSTASRLVMQITGNDHDKLEHELIHALDNDQFELYYQPQVSLTNRRIIGAEALIRWNHPERGVLSPASFVHELEKNGMINDVGNWVIESAVRELKQWKSLSSEDINVAVNLSTKQIRPALLQNTVDKLLTLYDIRPDLLELEITETIVVENNKDELDVLRGLKEIGVRLSVDDFGTGYSGLSYLQNFPFDIIKIDREFTRNISSNSKFTAIILAIINLADSLDMDIIAEGVENREELEFLKAQKCDIVQGYYFSPPVKAEDFRDLLTSGKVFDD